MNSIKKQIPTTPTLPSNFEELLEHLQSDEKLEDFATSLVKEYLKETWKS
ncbi:hypothetical protein [Ammoniphilus sp. YIM 78166]|nr:hypothetical protein [Ammoniphilus sp. YIM 78166]